MITDIDKDLAIYMWGLTVSEHKKGRGMTLTYSMEEGWRSADAFQDGPAHFFKDPTWGSVNLDEPGLEFFMSGTSDLTVCRSGEVIGEYKFVQNKDALTYAHKQRKLNRHWKHFQKK